MCKISCSVCIKSTEEPKSLKNHEESKPYPIAGQPEKETSEIPTANCTQKMQFKLFIQFGRSASSNQPFCLRWEDWKVKSILCSYNRVYAVNTAYSCLRCARASRRVKVFLTRVIFTFIISTSDKKFLTSYYRTFVKSIRCTTFQRQFFDSYRLISLIYIQIMHKWSTRLCLGPNTTVKNYPPSYEFDANNSLSCHKSLLSKSLYLHRLTKYFS